MNPPSISVIIPTCERPDGLRQCLRAILDGARPPEQIVVCDQSTGAATRRMMDSIRGGSTHVHYLHLERPNAAVARNAGLEAAHGDLVAYIDDDCIAGHDWLAALAREYAATSAQEEVAAVAGRVLPLFTAQNQVAVSARTSTVRRLYRARDGGMDRGEWAPWDTGTGANLLAPRTTLLAAGGFDPHLGPGTATRAAEDIDLLYRLAHAGTIVYQPAGLVYHPAESRMTALAKGYAYGIGMGHMLAKHLERGDPTARRLLATYVRLHGGEALRRRSLWVLLETGVTLAGFGRALLTSRLRAAASDVASSIKVALHHACRRPG